MSAKKILPPLGTLRPFEATARRLSFSKAAEELFVTQAAISKQVRLLEEYLDMRLFLRHGRTVSLTEEGKKFQHAVTMGLAHISEITTALKNDAIVKHVSVAMRLTFATHFIAPQLTSLQKEFPALDIKIITTNRNPCEQISFADMVIALGEISEPSLQTDFLFSEELFPICSPSYLEQNSGFTTIESLSDQTLLHLQDDYWRDLNWRPIDWHVLAEELGCKKEIRESGYIFDNYTALLQSAISGAGVAIGWKHLVCQQLKMGNLIRPVKETYKINRNHYLVMPRNHNSNSPEVKRVRKWIIDRTVCLREV